MPILSSQLELWGLNNDGTIKAKLLSNSLNNIFPNLTGVQNRDLVQQTYVVAWVNQHPSLPLTSGRIYFRVVDSRGAGLSIALDALGAQPKTGQVWTPGQTPATFTSPVTVGTGLSVPTLNPGYAIAVWVRRVATGGTAARPERNTLTLTGTTAA